MSVDIDQLRDIVIAAAREELLPRFTHVERSEKADGSVVTEADLVMQRRMAAELKQRWSQIAFLGEEMPVAEQAGMMASGEPLWCLDPLDGTSNFAAGIPYFVVSLALVEEGRITMGVVYDPSRDECFSAVHGQGCELNGKPLHCRDSGLTLGQSIGLIDFKRLPSELATRLVTQRPNASQRSFGSVALEWCWLAAGRCQVYLHGRQNIWDYAAGHLIFTEAGGYSCTLEGEAVFVDALIPRSAVAAVDTRLFDEWTDWLGVVRQG